MLGRGHHAASDDDDVLEADEGHEIRDKVHLAVDVEAEAGETERHANGAEHGDYGAHGNADLGADQFDLRKKERSVIDCGDPLQQTAAINGIPYLKC